MIEDFSRKKTTYPKKKTQWLLAVLGFFPSYLRVCWVIKHIEVPLLADKKFKNVLCHGHVLVVWALVWGIVLARVVFSIVKPLHPAFWQVGVQQTTSRLFEQLLCPHGEVW